MEKKPTTQDGKYWIRTAEVKKETRIGTQKFIRWIIEQTSGGQVFQGSSGGAKLWLIEKKYASEAEDLVKNAKPIPKPIRKQSKK
ncbi:MAG: hypothetical protein ACK5P5_05040 [Pseudobdellovibrionaceae bacterium]|jgi:hypothetical protein